MDHVQYLMQQGTLQQLMAHINPQKCPNSKINKALGDTIDAKAALEHSTAGKLNNTRGRVWLNFLSEGRTENVAKGKATAVFQS